MRLSDNLPVDIARKVIQHVNQIRLIRRLPRDPPHGGAHSLLQGNIIPKVIDNGFRHGGRAIHLVHLKCHCLVGEGLGKIHRGIDPRIDPFLIGITGRNESGHVDALQVPFDSVCRHLGDVDKF